VVPDPVFRTDLPVLAIDECELVPTGDAATLRVGGHWENAAPGAIQLYVPAEGFGALVDALPPGALSSDDGEWSAAFAVDPAAMTQRLALVPAVGRAVAFTVAETAQAPEPPPEDPAESDELVAQLRRRCERSERALADCREKLVQAWGQLDEARAALNEQQARYAAVAGKAEVHDVVPEPDPVTVTDEKPWTALDEVLLRRLARAKEFAGDG
jgi:hypothetical protein